MDVKKLLIAKIYRQVIGYRNFNTKKHTTISNSSWEKFSTKEFYKHQILIDWQTDKVNYIYIDSFIIEFLTTF